jgi:hypothetical protein
VPILAKGFGLPCGSGVGGTSKSTRLVKRGEENNPELIETVLILLAISIISCPSELMVVVAVLSTNELTLIGLVVKKVL